MYQPRIEEETIRSLYRMKQAYKKPMTKILQELVSTAVKTVSREDVCEKCKQQKNDECSECLLAQ
ncbi:hypothetical protein KAR91_61230 [Candidatus Pacearchaeota archaeon]|nr:hypothetical protein [Candidatus Pacearchaeota archaeon]